MVVNLFAFRQGVPIITISKDGKFSFWYHNIGNTYIADRFVALISYAYFGQGLLKHNLNRGIGFRQFLLHSVCSYFSSSFLTKLALFAGFVKLRLAFRRPYSPLMASGHSLFSAIRMSFAYLLGNPTFYRAKLLRPFASLSYILTTIKAFANRNITPSELQIASPRAIIRSCLPAVERIENLTTSKASLRYFSSVCCVTHTFNIAQCIDIVKRYCYTTANEIEEKLKRCSQSIMRLGI